MRLLITLIVAGVLGGPAIAQPSGADQVIACRGVRPDKAQLACFRRAADALVQAASPATEAAGPAEPPLERSAPAPFGTRPIRRRSERMTQPHSATMVVKSIGDLGDGRAILTMEDGSSWVETESEPLLGAVKPGTAVTIERGALGGYLLDLPHRAVIRVRRLKTE
jgi:hypothetical protein